MKQSSAADEIRNLRGRLDRVLADFNDLTYSHQELQSQCKDIREELADTRNKFLELRDKSHKDVVHRLAETESTLRLVYLK